MKRYLILTSDAGFGHRSAAEAIKAALEEVSADAAQITIVNPLDDSDLPALVKRIETGYDEMVSDDPTLYQLGYAATDAPVVAQLIQDITTTALNETMVKIVQQSEPDAIIVTYPAYTQAAVRACREVESFAPVHVVVTDLINVHSLWFHKEANLTFVPTGHVYKQALDNGLEKLNVKLLGMPVHPRIAREQRDKVELRGVLGWQPDLMTGLVVGSARSREITGIVRLLDRSGLNLQLAAVAGGNPDAENNLRTEQWKGAVHVYGKVDNIPEMMHAADFIVCKAGGLIVTEALACGLPLILYDALPGQEVGNVRYVTESGAGSWSPGQIGVLTTTFSWFAKDQLEFKQHRAAARQIGKPRAVYNIAETVIRSAAH